MLIATSGAAPKILGSLGGGSDDDPSEMPPLKNTPTVPTEQPIDVLDNVGTVEPKSNEAKIVKVSSMSVKAKKVEYINTQYNENPEPFILSTEHAGSSLKYENMGNNVYSFKKDTCIYNRLNSSELGKFLDELILVKLLEPLEDEVLQYITQEDILQNVKNNRETAIKAIHGDMVRKMGGDKNSISLDTFKEHISFKEDRETISEEINVICREFGVFFGH